MARYRSLHIRDIDPTPILNGTVQWRPVRRTLDVRAFGINAYSGEKSGDQVIEEHDAPAGTLVFLPDPASKRVAYAADPETTVLAIGGPVGRPYAVSPWES